MAEDKSTEQIQYEKLTSLFKTYAGYLTTFLTIISGLTIYVTYSDRNAIREDYKETIKDLKEEIAELKTESKESINKINQKAESELERVASNTNKIAIDETQKQLSYIFGTDKIQNLIEKQAVKEVKGKVVEIIEDETKNFSLILDAASRMRLGHYEGYLKLKEYSEYLPNPTDRANASQLLSKISTDYYLNFREAYDKAVFDESRLQKAYEDLEFPQEKRNLYELVKFIIDQINNKDSDLNSVAEQIVILSKFTKQPFKPFQIDEINKWFIDWQKTNKQLPMQPDKLIKN